ncbi:type I-F CRISPR-associated endoribonuclease Cas6/Csy4 [Stenotrophomonas mori]|uniref:Type I-F CRISPR-associated endoribonuclease Cas6/Csy4 n=1 Tax=Stenotrophomonas mori TaxID=2871096 RepID=A0ABT0SKF7_9GAMM|nr:type I-F CRISPR-associated endoribonuclease Cas6/Csy4 [Stenotrophomonas mori]
MTSHHVDIRVVPDPETTPTQLLGALYDRVHLALVRHRVEDIGVSFPGYSTMPRTLGRVLRLHGSEAGLRHFLQDDWLKGLRDHVRLTDIKPAPEGAPQRTVQRRQFKTSVERLRRRRMRRKGETEQQVQQAIPATVERQPDLPYLHLHSRSSGQSYCLFIYVGPPSPTAVDGHFNTYGLSSRTTIPWF